MQLQHGSSLRRSCRLVAGTIINISAGPGGISRTRSRYLLGTVLPLLDRIQSFISRPCALHSRSTNAHQSALVASRSGGNVTAATEWTTFHTIAAAAFPMPLC